MEQGQAERDGNVTMKLNNTTALFLLFALLTAVIYLHWLIYGPV